LKAFGIVVWRLAAPRYAVCLLGRIMG